MSRVYESMEHAQKVTFPQQPVMTSMPLSVETLPEPPTKLPSSQLFTKIDIKDLPKRFRYTYHMHVYNDM